MATRNLSRTFREWEGVTAEIEGLVWKAMKAVAEVVLDC